MSNNFEWQKHQVNERIQERLYDAENHRQTRDDEDRDHGRLSARMIIVAGICIIIAIWLLAGCTPNNTTFNEPGHTVDLISNMSFAERIHFQDRRNTSLSTRTTNATLAESQLPMTMTERIQFKDGLMEETSDQSISRQTSPTSSMVARIQFHDSLWERHQSPNNDTD